MKSRVIQVKIKIKEDRNRKELPNFIKILRPLTVTEYCTGVFRYTIKDGEISIATTKMKVYAISLFIFLSFFYFFDIITSIFDTSIKYISKLELFVYSVLCFFNLLYFFTQLFTFENQNKQNLEVVKILLRVDTILGDQIRMSNLFRAKLSFVLVLIFLFFVSGFVADFINDFINLCNLYAYIIDFRRHVAGISFIVHCYVLTSKLGFIHKELQCIVNTAHIPRTTIINNINVTSEQNNRIQTLANAFDLVVTALIKINEFYNFQIFLIFATSLFYTILLPIFWIYSFTTYLTTIIIYLPMEINLVCIICMSSVRILSKRNNIKLLLNELIINDNFSTSIRLQSKTFLDILNVSPMQMNVYDMFNLDLISLFKFISVVTTYLILIVQVTHIL